MSTPLLWLKENYKFLSIYDIEGYLGLPRKTLYKFVTGERELPLKYQKDVETWVINFKKGTLNKTTMTKLPTSLMNDQELYKKALKAYVAVCKRKRVFLIQPSESYSEVECDLVYLRNGSSLITIYNHRKERFEQALLEKTRKLEGEI